MHRSIVIKNRWIKEAKQKKLAKNLTAICREHTPVVVSPFKRFAITAIRRGWATNPTIKSVEARQANAMLDFLCSRALVFTAIITNRFNKMVTGQVVAWITMKAIRTALAKMEKSTGLSPVRLLTTQFKWNSFGPGWWLEFIVYWRFCLRLTNSAKCRFILLCLSLRLAGRDYILNSVLQHWI